MPSGTGRVAGKVALVMGVASDIGRATALLLAQEGALVAADIDGEGNKVADEIGRRGGQALAVPLDMTSEPAWQAAVNSVLRASGRLDITVNDAGVSAARPRKRPWRNGGGSWR